MAERAGVSNANISFWETGKRLVPLERLTALLDALRVTDDERERIIGLRRKADGPGELTTGSTNIGERVTRLIELERTATRITHVQPQVIPGLLQTSDYARVVFGDGPETDAEVALRAGRRDVITRRRNPVGFLALIDSEALFRPVGPPEVMTDQFDHLARSLTMLQEIARETEPHDSHSRGTRWRKSSISDGQDTCVELAHTGDGLRDSKNPAGPALAVGVHDLLSAVRSGRFDLP